jgi:hypothetical protein
MIAYILSKIRIADSGPLFFTARRKQGKEREHGNSGEHSRRAKRHVAFTA